MIMESKIRKILAAASNYVRREGVAQKRQSSTACAPIPLATFSGYLKILSRNISIHHTPYTANIFVYFVVKIIPKGIILRNPVISKHILQMNNYEMKYYYI